MYNTDLPNRADLPSSARLRRSTILAALAATTILVTAVLPAEYGLDPTGAGRLLGLTEMGEIKTQLAEEAAQDAATTPSAQPAASNPQLAARLDRIEAMLQELVIAAPGPTETGLPAAQAEPPTEASPVAEEPAEEQVAAAAAAEPASDWRDEVSFTLAPGEGAEFKLVMDEGAEAVFHWTANGGVVNYDTHGDGGGNSISYEKGRSMPEQAGELEAAFSGNHGWFWRNRGDAPVTMTLRTRGAYSTLKRVS
jgi:hypothetical protein